MIPVFDAKRMDKEIYEEIRQAMDEVLGKGIYILGEKVAEFEKKFSTYLGARYAVGVASGTDALSLALLAAGVSGGDEVILPANSYPSAFAVTQIGAIPKLVDIKLSSHTIDPSGIEKAVSKKTKAVMAVHMYGQPADLG